VENIEAALHSWRNVNIYFYKKGRLLYHVDVLRRTGREEGIFFIQNQWRSKASWRLGPAVSMASRNKDNELLKKLAVTFLIPCYLSQ
jgi:hypothetical protein